MRMVFETPAGESFREKLIPEGYEFGMSLLVGYPADAGMGKPHEPDRRKIIYV